MYFMMRGASSRRAASIVSAVADGAKVPARAIESARAAPALNEFHDELSMVYSSRKWETGSTKRASARTSVDAGARPTVTLSPAAIVIRLTWVRDVSEVIAESDLATGRKAARRTGARLGLLPVCSRSQTGTHELSDKLSLSP